MTWLLTWLTVSVATLNATLHLLVIYKFVAYNFFSKLSFTNVKFSHIHFVVVCDFFYNQFYCLILLHLK